MNNKDKISLIKRNSVEILNESQLESALKRKTLKVYCGYEPSGEIHLGHLVTIIKLLDFQKAGVQPIVLLADWHAWLNKKGDWKFLEKQVSLWEKGMKAAGLTKAKFIKGTSFQKKPNYVDDVMSLSLDTTVNRGLRAMQTVARDIDNAKISQMIYPLMQIADIKALNLDFVTSGIEQRKIHALATETFSKISFKKKPVFVHTGLITSLKGPGSKMSSSEKESMISIRDSPEDVKRKIKKAHCPQKQTKENPILEIAKYIIFPKFESFVIERSEEHGGNKNYSSYKELERDFSSGEIHPLDLKNSTSVSLNKLLEPIRKSWRN